MARAPEVVIVGGGFGGLEAARALRRAPVHVTLVDRRNHHLFQPLLYQVATAALNPADVSAPIRHVLRKQENAEVVLGDVAGVDVAGRRVRLADGAELPYDFLVVATGATHSYFGHDEWAPLAPGLKTIEDAVEIRRRALLAFELAERERDEARRSALLSFVVVGGGPTGVELAGALAEIATRTLAADFRHIRPESARVVLLEAAPRVLPAFSERLSRAARAQLARLGVEVRTGARVTGIDGGGVIVRGRAEAQPDEAGPAPQGAPTRSAAAPRGSDLERAGDRGAQSHRAPQQGDDRIASGTVLWAAGVAASPMARSLGAPLDRAGRVLVNPDLSLPGHPEVLAVGDVAAVRRESGELVPGLAPAAIQEGRHAARAIVRALRGEPPLPFRYRDEGMLATIGRAAAVARIGRLEFSGLLAWLAWLFIHIYFLIGFRNRVAVILEWAWSYLTFKRGARLITDTAERWRLGAQLRGEATDAPSRSPPERVPASPSPARSGGEGRGEGAHGEP